MIPDGTLRDCFAVALPEPGDHAGYRPVALAFVDRARERLKDRRVPLRVPFGTTTPAHLERYDAASVIRLDPVGDRIAIHDDALRHLPARGALSQLDDRPDAGLLRLVVGRLHHSTQIVNALVGVYLQCVCHRPSRSHRCPQSRSVSWKWYKTEESRRGADACNGAHDGYGERSGAGSMGCVRLDPQERQVH